MCLLWGTTGPLSPACPTGGRQCACLQPTAAPPDGARCLAHAAGACALASVKGVALEGTPGHHTCKQQICALCNTVEQTATARPPQQQEQCQQQQRQQCCLGPCGRCSRHMATSCCSIAWQAVCQHPADQAFRAAQLVVGVCWSAVSSNPRSSALSGPLVGHATCGRVLLQWAVEEQLLGGCATPTRDVPASSAAARWLNGCCRSPSAFCTQYGAVPRWLSDLCGVGLQGCCPGFAAGLSCIAQPSPS